MQILTQTLQIERSDRSFTAELCLIHGTLDVLISHYNTLLHSSEVPRFSNFTSDKRQLSYLLGRFAAKQAIANYLNIDTLNRIYIQNGVFEQPIAYYPASDKIQVSITHSENIGMAIAFPECHPMGIDLEKINPEHLEVLIDQMTPAEIRWVESNTLDPITLYTLLWTSKEALSKSLRTGLMVPFKTLETSHFKIHADHYTNEFKHFSQYRGLSLVNRGFVLSLVYPRNTNLPILIEPIQHWFQNL